ncbi:MAG: ComEA family DNA-binding protein [Eubacteriales bacterium]|nr:ComEA family DNA-binding protein [Eubacteriales bacterium]
MAKRVMAGLGVALLCCLALALIGMQLPPTGARLSLSAAHSSMERMPVPTPAGAVNINAAGEDELCLLTGIGPALAQRIIDEREQNGPFAYAEDLTAVKGIGQKTLEKIDGQFSLE